MKIVEEARREIPVVSTVDICVIGGSCTGVFAAVRAARLGARVALVEKQNCFGGTATAGLVNIWHSLMDSTRQRQIIGGLTEEVIEKLERVGGCQRTPMPQAAYQLDTELLKIELDRLVINNNIEPFLHTFYCAPYLDEGHLRGIFIENKDGRQAIQADFFIDASGDGDLAYHLGLDHYEHSNKQPPTPAFKLYGDLTGVKVAQLLQEYGPDFGLPDDWGWGGPIPGMPKLSFRADTHVFGVDCASAADLTRAEIEGRRQMRAVVDLLSSKTGKNIRLAATSSHLGIRETRHFASDFRLNRDDLLYGVSFPDCIACGTYQVDIHHTDDAGITLRFLDGSEVVYHDRSSPGQRRMWRQDGGFAKYYQIPFRTLVQRKVPNLILAGRMIDADPDAFGAVRVMVNLNQVGEAAGVAAYLAVQKNQPVWQIDAAMVRKLLKRGGSILSD